MILLLAVLGLLGRSAVRGSLENTPDSSITVVGIAGEKIALPCDVSPDTSDDDVVLVLWYKDDFVAPIYSLDARRRSVSQARHAVSDALASRAYLTIGQQPALLELSPLELSDDGHYRCRVDFRKAQTRNADILLKVTVPPKKPVIMDFNGETLQSLIGPYNEGDQLLLVCESEGGKPKPSVTWWRESVLLDDTFEVSNRGTVRNELEVSNLQRHDLMAMLTCQASNSNLSSPMSAAVTVDMNFKPQKVIIDQRQRPLSARKLVEITCRSQGSRPPAVITWWKGSSRMTNTKDRVSVDGYETTSILTFTPTVEDSGVYLSCRAENPLIPGSAVEDGWKLEVYFIPQLSLRLGSKLRHSHIQEGNDVYFECNIRANPWVTDIGWRFEGLPLQTNVSAGIIVTNQSLVLQKVTRFQRSRYTCWASNSEGRGESNPIHLRVQYAPVCLPQQKILYGAAIDEVVKIICEVDADPQDLHFKWAFNNSLDSIEILTFGTEGVKSTLTYSAHTQYEYGSLLCWARNSVGEQREPCVFNIFPAGPPEPVSNCTVHNLTEYSVTVDCIEGYDGGLKQHYIMELYDPSLQNLQTTITSDVPSFLLEGLPAGVTFVAVVFAVNLKGRSESHMLKTSTLTALSSRRRKDRTWDQNTIPVLVIVVVIIVLINIVIVIVILVVKSRKRSRQNATNTMDRRKDYRVLFPKTDEVFRDSGGEEKCPDVIPDSIKSAQSLLEEASMVKFCETLVEDQSSPLETFSTRMPLHKTSSSQCSLKAIDEEDAQSRLSYITSRQTVV